MSPIHIRLAQNTMKSTIATAVLLAGSASAHTIFQKLYVNGADQGELVGIRAPDSNYVRDFTASRFHRFR